MLLYRKLEADHQRSLGSRDRHRKQTRISKSSTADRCPQRHPHGYGESTCPDTGNRKTVWKRSDYTSAGQRRGFHQFYLPGSKIRRVMAARGESEAAQRAHHLTPFQDGICQDSQEFTPEGRLVGETRPQRRILDSAHAPGTSEISQVSVAEPILAVQGSPFWPQQCPVHIYEADEAGSVTLKEPEHQDDTLLGRHVDHGRDPRGGIKVSGDSAGSFSGSGFCDQYTKELPHPQAEVGVPGIRPGHSPDDNSTPRDQTSWSAEDVQGNGTTGCDQPEGIGPIAGYHGCEPPCNSPNSPPLPLPGENKITSTPERSTLRDGSAGMLDDLRWWQDKLSKHNGRTLQVSQWDVTIESDASMMGWGASCQDTPTGGSWTREEKANSINYLELLAAFLALQSFASGKRSVRILLRIDNITAIAFLNRMGGPHSRLLSDLAIEVWEWCLRRDIIIHAEHLPGKENIRADWESRHTSDCSDWMLHRGVFLQLEETFGPFSVDLFASRTNAQLPIYCSWRADTTAWTVDAFSISWAGMYPYLFPLFALIPACLDKISREEVSAVLIAPVWPGQLWFPQLLRKLMRPPILLPHTQDIVSDPEGQAHSEGSSANGRLACLRHSFHTEGLSDRVIEVIRRSWRKSTESAYSGAWKLWDSWCSQRSLDPLSVPVSEILEFLLEQCETGKQYHTINTIRSAISMTHEEVDGTRIGQHPLVSRFLKGVFNCRPPVPKYSCTWDVDIVLSYLKDLPDNESLPFQLLSHKVAMLMVLSNADRCSDLAALHLRYRFSQANEEKFIIPGLTK